MSRLQIASNLSLPTDMQTSTVIVLGGKGMGKTNLGRVIDEELSRLGLRWATLDPLGVWWGLRYSKDGKGKGIECLILGGVHGDMPIEPTGGAVVADLVVDEHISVIIDFSRKASGEMWGIGEKTRFLTDYAQRLYRRQGELVNGHRREPLFQMLDEAARYVPQMITHGNPDLAKCLGAWETLVEEGRNIGIGVGLLTQRSARINKSVSELADALFAFRTVGPNSVEAVTDWLGAHVPKDKIKVHIETLRSLERGRCLVVSPGWLQFEGIANIREGQTFDSSATPKQGERGRTVKGAGAVPDLAKYQERMRETIERTKNDDPRELRGQIQKLKAEIATRPTEAKNVVDKGQLRETNKRISLLKAALEDALKIIAKITAIGFDGTTIKPEEIQKALDAASAQIVKTAELKLSMRSREFASLQNTAASALERMRRLLSDEQIEVDVTVRRNEPFTVAPSTKPNGNAKPRAAVVPNGDLSGPEQRILNAIAWLNSIGVRDPEQTAVAFLAGYTIGGGAWGNPRGRLNSRGFVEYLTGDRIRLTDAGREHAQCPEEPLSTDELQDRVLNRLPGPEQKILRVLLENRQGLSNEDLAGMAGYAVGGGAYGNPRGRLKTLGLIEYRSGLVVPKPLLFLESE